MTHNCVAIAEQRSWRDLRELERAVAAVRWMDAGEVAAAPEPLVACGLWGCRDPAASSLLHRRAEAGLSSLLVARFEPMNLGPLLGAPVSVEISPGETSALAWEDGRRYEVPSVAVIQTALAEGHWARSTAGTTVLAYRPHTRAGLFVLCTATVAGRALGTNPQTQQALLERVLDEIARRAPERTGPDEAQSGSAVCATAAEYLERHGADGALVLLAALQTKDGRVDDAALQSIGAALPEDRLASLLAAKPATPAREIEQVLRAAGWGAHLRALARRRTEAS